MAYLPCRLDLSQRRFWPPFYWVRRAGRLLSSSIRRPPARRPTGADRFTPPSRSPNGRIAAPAGRACSSGSNPLGLALSPDGRYADSLQRRRGPGHAGLRCESSRTRSPSSTRRRCESRATIKTRRQRSSWASQRRAIPNDPSRTLVLASDGAGGSVRIFDLDAAGQLTLRRRRSRCPRAPAAHAFPAEIAIAPDEPHRLRRGQSRRRGRRDRSRIARGAPRAAGRSLSALRCRGRPQSLAAGTGLSAYASLNPPVARAAVRAARFRSVEVVVAHRI